MVDLILLPFAGGTSLIYDEWIFSSNINPIRIDYKGHGFRIKEPLYASFEEMIDDVAKEVLAKRKNDTFAIFGHSMGGLVAWDTAKLLAERGVKVSNVFISACLPPHLFKESLYREMATDEWLHGFLRQYGRIKTERMESRIFKNNIFPAIKNDYRLISIHKHEGVQSIEADLTCFYGIQDELMPSSGLECWSEYTLNNFSLKGFTGGHFYIETRENRERIIREMELLISR